MSDNFRFAQLQPFTLAGAGAVIGDTSITLKSMTDIDGSALSMSGDFGTIGFGTIDPGNGTLEEQISFSGLTNNANGTVTLSGVKNVLFLYPYTQTSGLFKTHAGSAPFVISNTSGFYDELTSKTDDETITGTWTFPSTDPTRAGIGSDVDTATNTAFVTFGQLSRQAIAGAANASETVKGLVQLATPAQAAAGTSTGSSAARLTIPTSMSTATGATGTTVAVISQTDGTIAPAFIDPTGNYNFTGIVTGADTSGIIVPFGGFSAPTGWLLCDGAAVSRATYAHLFSITNTSLGTVTMTIATPCVVSFTAHGMQIGDSIYFTTTNSLPTGVSANTQYFIISAGFGVDSFEISASFGGAAINTSGSQSGVHTLHRTAFGVGNGSTTFNVPNMKGQVAVGLNTSDANFRAVNQTGGEATHTLTTPEIPSHLHTYNVQVGGGGTPLTTADGKTTGTNSTNLNTSSTGGDGAHNNLQPYVSLNYIIKT